jgi:hypothetical protein
MRFTRWLAPLALVGGMASAVVFAGDNPLAPRSLPIECVGSDTGLSYDGVNFCAPSACDQQDGLTLLRPTYVRGPACISVHAGTCVYVPAGSVVLVSWEPSARGWRFQGVTGESIVHFENTCVRLGPCDSITLLTGGPLEPFGFHHIEGLQPVSGFEPFEDDVEILEFAKR